MNTRMKFLRRYIISKMSSEDPFTYFDIDNGNLETLSYIGENQTPTVPAMHEGNHVLWIGDQTFAGNTDITSVTISNGIEEIK